MAAIVRRLVVIMKRNKANIIALLVVCAVFKVAEIIAVGVVNIEERSKHGRKQAVARAVKP